MASPSDRLSLFAAVILLQSLVLSASAYLAPAPAASPGETTEFIDAVCQRARHKDHCLETLTSYPPATSATSQIPLAEAVISLGISHAEKTIAFIDETAKKEPARKAALDGCASAYRAIVGSFIKAAGELEESPDMANDDVEAMNEQIRQVKELVGRNNNDLASQTLMEKTEQMENYVDIAGGATDAVDDDHENVHAHH